MDTFHPHLEHNPRYKVIKHFICFVNSINVVRVHLDNDLLKKILFGCSNRTVSRNGSFEYP